MALELSDPKPLFDFLDKCTTAESREAWSLGQPVHGGYYTEEQATAIAKWANDPKLHFPATVSVDAVGQPPVGPRFKLQLTPKLGTFKPVKRVCVQDRYTSMPLDSMDAIYAVYLNGAATMRVSGTPDVVKFTSSILKEAFPASLAANSSITFDGYVFLYVAQFNRAPVEDPFKDLVGKPLRFLGDKEYRIHGGVLTVGSPVIAPTPVPVPVSVSTPTPEPVSVSVPVPEPVAPMAAAATAVAPAAEPPVAVSVSDDKWVEVPSSPEPKTATPLAEVVSAVATPATTDPFAADLVAPTTLLAKRQLWSKMNTVLLGLKMGDIVFVRTGLDTPARSRGLLCCKLVCDIEWGDKPGQFSGKVFVSPVNVPSVSMTISFNGDYLKVTGEVAIFPTRVREAAITMLTSYSYGATYNPSLTRHSLTSVVDSITVCDSA